MYARLKDATLGQLKDAVIAKDVDKMRRDELMKYATEVLKVETRRDGRVGKHIPQHAGGEARLQGRAVQASPVFH